MRALTFVALFAAFFGTAHAAWKYQSDTDKMGRGKVDYAITTSVNQLNFRFPYNGGSLGRIWIRKGSPRDAVMVDVTKGQMLCGFSDCSVTLRFDNEKPTRWTAAKPSDGSSDTLFILNHRAFVTKALKSKRLMVEIEFFQNGPEILEFDLTGLQWKW